MAVTHSLISTVTVGAGGAANIEFTSIPATYTDLLIRISARSTAAVTLLGCDISLNSSTSNFVSRLVTADGSTMDSYSNQARRIAVIPGANATASTFSNDEIYIPNYAGSKHKQYGGISVVVNLGTTFAHTYMAGRWADTSAITSITLTPGSGNFAQYSTAYLYGIKKN